MKDKGDTNIVYVSGKRYDREKGMTVGKDLSAYLLAVIEQLASNDGNVSIQARGMATSRAIDVAAITERNKRADITDIKIKSSKFEKEGREMHVSEIEITMKKDK